MTEQQVDPLLADLLESNTGQQTTEAYQPPLSRSDEQRLLHEANEAGTPTLAPRDMAAGANQSNGASFASDIIGLVRRYPVPTLLAAVGVAYVLTRRRSH